MNPVEHDDDLRALRGVGSIEPPRELSARIRRQGHAQLARRGGWVFAATRAWTRVGLPAALAVMVIGYLSWAVTSASALYR